MSNRGNRARSVEPAALDPARALSLSPCRAVVEHAELRMAELGHENEGFLSWSRGYVPRLAPLERLGGAHAAWDELANELPELHRSLKLRRSVEALPLLDASADALDDRLVLRACSLLAMVAQAYWYVELGPPERLPEVIRKPWSQLRQRLGREQEVLSYIDLIVYNWRLARGVSAGEELTVESTELLFPTVGNREEHVFYLTQLEILARSSPIIQLATLAQEAALRDDSAGMEQALLGVTALLRGIVRTSLPKINPHPSSSTHVDPVVWAKTVAPFAVPMRSGDQGPSGTSSPLFNTLDVLFGRVRYESFLGREIRQLRSGYPEHWRAFLDALAQVSISAYVERTKSDALRGAWREAFDAYAGPNGFLGRHRMKVYGYLELAFKVGRAVTIGGFGGVFKDRTWDQVDSELSAAQGERFLELPGSPCEAQVSSRDTQSGAPPGGVRHVTLDVSQAGVRYQVGDRCAIFPENSPELIARTLAALSATGDEIVSLTDEWRVGTSVRREVAGKTHLTIREVLRLGCIRPVSPRMAEALHALTQSRLLLEQIGRGTTERWELWELIELLRGEGLDPVQLWSEPLVEHSERLCRLIPPERARLYSISSAVSAHSGEPARTIELTVGHLLYESSDARHGVTESPAGCPFHGAPERLGKREGTASSFLARAENGKTPIPFQIERPGRFQLPEDARVPIVFFAGGTGISPFRAFLQERATHPEAGPCWLLWSLRDKSQFISTRELVPALTSGLLELDVCFTREGARVRRAATGLELEAGPSKRIDELVREPQVSEKLASWLLPERGAGAALYICGPGGFARTVLDALEAALDNRGHDGDDLRGGREALSGLMGNNRLFLEIHTGSRPEGEVARWIDISDVAEHNDEALGYWTIIDRAVYDLTRFVTLHPGGARVIQSYAGLDATHGYARAHGDRSEVDAMREMYRIGRVRPLEFDEYTTEASGPSGPHRVNCRTAHAAWVKALHLVVEMQNALAADHSLMAGQTTRDEPPDTRCPYKLSRAAETHYRFLKHYQRVLEADTLPNLWRISQPLFIPNQDADWMERELVALRSTSVVREMYALAADLYQNFWQFAADPKRLDRIVATFSEADARLLRELKQALSDGLKAFEKHGARTRTCGAREIEQACQRALAVLRESAIALADEVQQCMEGSERRTAIMSDLPPRHLDRLYGSVHWILEEQPEKNIMLLERTPVPFSHLEQVREENERILACLGSGQHDRGLLVDLRQAPTRNDPHFENAMSKLRDGLRERFLRMAILLDSSLGELQVTRIERDERNSALVTRSESNALTFLLGGK